MECVELSCLPLEIIEQILECEELSFMDVLHFGSTCNMFWELVSKSNLIWKAKFKQRWPQLINHEGYKVNAVKDWLGETRHRQLIGQQAVLLISAMSFRHINHEELSNADFKDFDSVLSKTDHSLACRFMIDELMMCVCNEERNTNLTKKYYGEKALRYLRQVELKLKWEAFKTAPPEQQIMERGAVIVAQWSQPTEEITDDLIGSNLDAIVDNVRQLLLEEHGEKHPALSVAQKELECWRKFNLTDNYHSPYVSRQIINAVSTVLFKQMGFYGNSDLYYSHENSYIDKVLSLRRGIPITLSVVFESVTRRLGVKCEPVSFPGHFLLRWRDTYKENMPTQYFYIDVFNGGVFLGRDSCPQFANGQGVGRCPMSEIFRFGPATAVQVVERMANNLEVAGRQHSSMNGRAARLRSALELLHLINPANLNCMLQLARFYMQYNMDVSSLRNALLTLAHFDLRDMGQASYILRTLIDYDDNFRQNKEKLNERPKVKTREGLEIVQFGVGMVMRHRQFVYTCVIIGWDPVCAASEEWINQMNVRSLSRQQRQPFYHVLVADGTNRYAAEENLVIESYADGTTHWVSHCDVGRYFDTFCGNHYRPNAELLEVYPDDPPVVAKLLSLQ